MSRPLFWILPRRYKLFSEIQNITQYKAQAIQHNIIKFNLIKDYKSNQNKILINKDDFSIEV